MYTHEREKVLTILTFIAAWKYSFELKNSIRLLWSGSSFFFVCSCPNFEFLWYESWLVQVWPV